MKGSPLPYRIFPLGDSALVIDFGNQVNTEINSEVIRRSRQISEAHLQEIIEVLPAYSSIGVYYHVSAIHAAQPETVFDHLRKKLEKLLGKTTDPHLSDDRKISIPVCYEKGLAPDLESTAATKNMEASELIKLHCAVSYKVYMLGFLPGFAYMGELDERIAVPRKGSPQLVKAGSVGLAGRQTGIYPMDSPGGWQIIGKTPLKLFDKEKEEPALLRAGDIVTFYSISLDEFKNY